MAEYAFILIFVGLATILMLTILGGFAQVEYRVLHGTFMCSGDYADALGNGNVLVFTIDSDTNYAPGKCVQIQKDSLVYAGGGVDIPAGGVVLNP